MGSVWRNGELRSVRNHLPPYLNTLQNTVLVKRHRGVNPLLRPRGKRMDERFCEGRDHRRSIDANWRSCSAEVCALASAFFHSSETRSRRLEASMIRNPQVGGFAFERVDLSLTVCRRIEVGSSIDKLYPTTTTPVVRRCKLQRLAARWVSTTPRTGPTSGRTLSMSIGTTTA